MNVKVLRLAGVIISLALPNCDPIYKPVLCNGYEVPVVVTAIFDGGIRKGVASLSKGECKAETLVITSKGSNSSSSTVQPHALRNEIIVTSATGETLASYSEEANSSILSGRSFTPHYLLTDKGLFLIPREFEDNWLDNASVIERTATVSFPNRLRTQ